jgi:hypothetical protein
MNFSRTLCVMAKRPTPGGTKTRLSPPLSPEQAAALYEGFLCDTLELIRGTPAVRRVLAYLPSSEAGYFRRLAPDFERVLQSGQNLGERLDNLIQAYLRKGSAAVVAMDSDSPNLPAAYLAQAFEALEGGADVTLGPCEDGGYYLIGLARPAPRLLREVQMSTAHVLADTLVLAEAEGRRVHLLPGWYDVDDAASLARLRDDLQRTPGEVAIHTRRCLEAI